MDAGKMIMEASCGSVIQGLLGRLSSSIAENVQSVSGITQQKEQLSKLHNTISVVLQDAEEICDETKVGQLWISRLQNLIYDIQCQIEEMKMQESQFLTRRWMFPFTKLMIGSLSKKMESIIAELNDFSRDVAAFSLRSGRKRRRSDAEYHSGSLTDKSGIFGRTRDAEVVIASLISGTFSGDCVEILPVEGMGGVGKTTLAQLVYNDERVEEHFVVRGWVHVSSDDFSKSRVTKALVESITGEPFPLSDFEPMQRRLRQILTAKRFLVVLDDLWNEDSNAWNSFKLPFLFSEKGSRILVTTRSRRVSSIVGTIPTHSMECLPEDDAWKLFEKEVFGSSCSSDYPDLVTLGREIVRKCSGLPLALKIFASALRYEFDIDVWHMILQSSAWDEPENGVLRPLKVSYNCLAENLKQCFAFCSIFPKGYEFDKDQLILMWSAQCYTGSRLHSNETACSLYFNELFSKFFFQHSTTDISRFKMHDVIHDLAQSVSHEICIRLHDDDGTNNLPTSARHASVVCVNIEQETIDAIRKSQQLQTLIFFARDDIVDFTSSSSCIEHAIHDGLFRQLKYLRLLDLSSTRIRELPSSIGELKGLRYLDLSWTCIMYLPEEVCTLSFLQTLKLNDCRNLVELPDKLELLQNLRHIAMEGDLPNLVNMSKGLYRLTGLRTLSKFVVGRHTLHCLQRLAGLGGSISISKLENVVEVDDAKRAKLEGKHLQKLELRWSDGPMRQGNEEEVLEALRPHHDTRHLVIYGYRGRSPPSWISSLHMLVSLSLHECRECVTLPPISELPCLKKLQITSLHQATLAGHYQDHDSVGLFPSLEILTFKDLPNLEEWFVKKEGAFPCLAELEVVDCPRLKELPDSLPSLMKLELRNTNGLTSYPRSPSLQHLVLDGCKGLQLLRSLTFCTSLSSLVLSNLSMLAIIPPDSLQYLSMLRNLDIKHMDELQLLSSEDGLYGLVSLQKLLIKSCPRLVRLPTGLPIKLTYLEISSCDSLRHLPQSLKNSSSLESLIIIKCPGLESLEEVELPTMLKELHISSCDKLRTLPRTLPSLSSLFELKIMECPKICSLPERLPSSLQYLVISKCPLLEVQCQKEHGSDWPKIEHIARVLINEEWMSLI